MKKTMITFIATALLVLQAISAFAFVSPYLGIRSVNPRPTVSQVGDCNLDIQTNTADVRFVGKARQECIEKNHHNLFCQRKCSEQVRLLITGQAGRERGMYSRIGCKDADPVLFSGATAGQCHSIASNECMMINGMNDYCRRKCVEKAYNLCRQQRARTYGL